MTNITRLHPEWFLTYGNKRYFDPGNKETLAWQDVNQLPRQVEAIRNTPNMNGMIFFSSKTFEKNPNGWNDSLRLNYFRDPVKVPEMEWLK